MMPANRAAASTFPFATVCACIRWIVARCNLISPDATASRISTGLADTSTIAASPRALMCVSRSCPPTHQHCDDLTF